MKKTTAKKRIHESEADDEGLRGWQDFFAGEAPPPMASDWYLDGYEDAEKAHRDNPEKYSIAMRETTIKTTKRQLRKVIRESIERADQVVSAYDSGASDAEEGYDAGSYHDWIDGDEELMASYDRGHKDGSGMEEIPDRQVSRMSRDQFQKTYGDMDVGVRGKAGY